MCISLQTSLGVMSAGSGLTSLNRVQPRAQLSDVFLNEKLHFESYHFRQTTKRLKMNLFIFNIAPPVWAAGQPKFTCHSVEWHFQRKAGLGKQTEEMKCVWERQFMMEIWRWWWMMTLSTKPAVVNTASITILSLWYVLYPSIDRYIMLGGHCHYIEFVICQRFCFTVCSPPSI